MAEHRVLLVEPFLGGSHRAWAEGWQQHSRHDVDILCLQEVKTSDAKVTAETAAHAAEVAGYESYWCPQRRYLP